MKRIGYFIGFVFSLIVYCLYKNLALSITSIVIAAICFTSAYFFIELSLFKTIFFVLAIILFMAGIFGIVTLFFNEVDNSQRKSK